MTDLYRQVVFTVGETEYRWDDVVLAAALRGEWREVVQNARNGLALMAAADEEGELPVTDEDIENAANEFRYDHDLLTVDEVEGWVSRWGLSVDTWMGWVTSDTVRKAADDSTPPAEPSASREELDAAVLAEAIFSGAFNRMAYRLAGRAAVSDKLKAEGVKGATPAGEGPPEPVLPDDPIFAEAAPHLSADELRAKLTQLAQLESDFQNARSMAITPQTLEARVRSRQSDWMRVSTKSIQLPSEDMAREALFSIREDGLDMSEVAADAKAELAEGTFFLEELEPGIRNQLLAAQKGEYLGPLKSGDAYSIYLLVDKVFATSQDPVILAKAEKTLMGSLQDREIDNRVSWKWKR